MGLARCSRPATRRSRRTTGGRTGCGQIATWFSNFGRSPRLTALAVFVLLLFPDGRLPSPRWRAAAVVRRGRGGAARWSGTTLCCRGPMTNVPPDVTNPVRRRGGPFVHGEGFARRRDPRRRAGARRRGRVRRSSATGAPTTSPGSRSSLARGRGRVHGVQQPRRRGHRRGLRATRARLHGLILLGMNSRIPAAVGLAMLRYRLYDVDVVIRRTRTYGALVGMLAGLYLAGVAGLGAGLRAATGRRAARCHASRRSPWSAPSCRCGGASSGRSTAASTAPLRRQRHARSIQRPAAGADRPRRARRPAARRPSARRCVPRTAQRDWLAPVTIPERASGKTEVHDDDRTTRSAG